MTHQETAKFDILVVGGGIAGLTQTLALADAGFEVACVDPLPASKPPVRELDGRTTALLQGALNVLRRLEVWPACHTRAGALERMCIVDEAGRPPRAPKRVCFDSREAGSGPFGYNTPNAVLRRALVERLAVEPAVWHFDATALTTLRFESTRAVAVLSNGQEVTANLVVGADGKDSPCRISAGIPVRRWSYGQAAIAFAMTHSRSHHNVSTEFHRTTGPFVLVPLPGQRSSVVWVGPERGVSHYMDMQDADFRRAVMARTRGVVGNIEDIGRRGCFPAVSLIADRYAAPRLALVGEAAHAMPPIGAQGLNLGLTDVAALTEVLAEARQNGADSGAPEVLARYEARRRADVMTRVFGIDTLNRNVMSKFPPAQALRHVGLTAVSRIPALRTRLMRRGMTPVGSTPRLMQPLKQTDMS